MKVLMLTNMYPTPNEPWFGCFVKDQVEDIREHGLDVEVLHVDARRDWTAYLTGARRVRTLVASDHFDLIHAHYGLTGAMALAQHVVPTVTTFHGGDYTGEVQWHKLVSWGVARRSTPIVVSREGRRRLRRPNAQVIPAPVDTELFRPRDEAQARADLGWSQNARYALFPSNPRHTNKRADLFESALQEARRSQPSLEPVYLQGLSRNEVALVMNAVDVTVLTSNFEGSPVTVRESLACNTPVVSVPVGDVAETLEGLPGCAITPREPHLLAGGILAALEAGRSTELRERALCSSRARTADRVVAVYELTLARHRSRRTLAKC
jgi:glycosyltransferase involved in cell wall biosynthesis